jgi:hypothetical protein
MWLFLVFSLTSSKVLGKKNFVVSASEMGIMMTAVYHNRLLSLHSCSKHFRESPAYGVIWILVPAINSNSLTLGNLQEMETLETKVST